MGRSGGVVGVGAVCAGVRVLRVLLVCQLHQGHRAR